MRHEVKPTCAAGDGIPRSDTCTTGQTYCVIYQVSNSAADGSQARCRTLDASCGTNPTCGCVEEGHFINCTCTVVNGAVTARCDAV